MIMDMPPLQPSNDKKLLRRQLQAERQSLIDRHQRAMHLQEVLRVWLASRPETAIGAYWPIKGEFDALPAAARTLSKTDPQFFKSLEALGVAVSVRASHHEGQHAGHGVHALAVTRHVCTLLGAVSTRATVLLHAHAWRGFARGHRGWRGRGCRSGVGLGPGLAGEHEHGSCRGRQTTHQPMHAVAIGMRHGQQVGDPGGKGQQPGITEQRVNSERYDLGLDMAWELDLFGRIGSLSNAELNRYFASEATARWTSMPSVRLCSLSSAAKMRVMALSAVFDMRYAASRPPNPPPKRAATSRFS